MKYNRIYLIGMMGVGKTSIGKKLAKLLDFSFFDLDTLIEQKQQKKISEIFENDGELVFRELEKENLINFKVENAVLATGGGTPAFFNNIDFMLANGLVVWLHLPTKMMSQRIIASNVKRPLAVSKDIDELSHLLENLLSKRASFYQRAHLSFETKNVTPEKLAELAQLVQNQLK